MAIIYDGFGNILNHAAQTITCPVNSVGVMGAGVALFMRNRIQGLNDHYKHLIRETVLYPGLLKTYKIPEKEQQVLLFPTKDHWENNSKIEYIEDGLKYLSENYKELGITELAMLPLGCGLGKLDYTKDVKPLLYKYLEPLDIPVYLLHRETT